MKSIRKNFFVFEQQILQKILDLVKENNLGRRRKKNGLSGKNDVAVRLPMKLVPGGNIVGRTLEGAQVARWCCQRRRNLVGTRLRN